jgi:hypothetical protein
MLAFLWTDTKAGNGINNNPNLFSTYYYVPTGIWSAIAELSTCTGYDGKILWPRVATELIKKGDDSYDVPIVFGQLNPSGNDLDPANFIYIHHLNFSLCDILGAPEAVIAVDGTPQFCAGDSLLLVAASDSVYSFQWQLNGAIIEGATNDSLWVQDSGQYTLKVTNTKGCKAEDAITVTMNPLPVATIVPQGDTTICFGDSVRLVLNDTVFPGYQWLKDGVVIPGATQAYYTASPEGVYTVVVSDSFGCSAPSNGIAVVPLSPVFAIIEGLDLYYCITDSDVVLEGIPAGGIFTGPFDSATIFSPSGSGVGGIYFYVHVYRFNRMQNNCH